MSIIWGNVEVRAQPEQESAGRRRRLLLIAVVLMGLALAPASPALGRAYRPYMGVDTWYAFGDQIDERVVVSLADAVVRTGLRSAGYRYVWLDAGWWEGSRDAAGNIVVDPAQWPHGMAWLAAFIHSQGLLAGIYTDAGTSGCRNGGSFGHYQQDVNKFAAWGFDAVKVDFCSGAQMHLNPRVAYAQFASAIAHDQPHRPLLLNICNAAEPGHYGGTWPPYTYSALDNWAFAPLIATSWRTSYDVGRPGWVPFSRVLHNLYLDSAHPEAARDGHFNDPDYIVPDEGMTRAEARTQFSMWAMLAAPMMVSTHPESLPPATLQMLENPDALAISQDPAGLQGRWVARGRVDVWVRPLANGQKAVAFLNRSRSMQQASAAPALIGLAGARDLSVLDVWGPRTTIGISSLTVTVPPHGTVLLRVAAGCVTDKPLAAAGPADGRAVCPPEPVTRLSSR